jgi:starch synthase (maltosyl-transferring)
MEVHWMNHLGALDGRKRVVIEGVQPEINGGRFPIKRVPGEEVIVEADVFGDGHDVIDCMLLYRRLEEKSWKEAPMKPLTNDRWQGSFRVANLGCYVYTVEGWTDRFRSWCRDFRKRIDAGQDVRVDVLIGVSLIQEAAERANGADREQLAARAKELSDQAAGNSAKTLALDQDLALLTSRYPDRRLASRYDKELIVRVDREKARFSSWYEIFPRSCSPDGRKHGTLAECESKLPYIASMGFDVLYLPPIHPIGVTNRKGKNNVTEIQPGDVGSPWAIGNANGGHKSIAQELGTFEDFKRLVKSAERHGMEIAMDLAFQCAPDHPYVGSHPEWFRMRPDGTIQYAENPPKKYQDIYPLEFETDDWRSLWKELRSVVQFWMDKGVRIFRVDNPHTKPFPFWEWLINDVQETCPDVIFLAEAFTRPKVMYRLAKSGFSQSYTYFAWRNTKQELTDYFSDLTKSDIREYFRPNLWPNTPDILPEYLQLGGRPAYMIRLVLAATLGASYGIYGPAFELCENVPRSPGSEEYLNSEKYEIKHRDLNSPWSLKDFISRINRIRKENTALQKDLGLCFHEVDNPMLLCYSKTSEDQSNVIVAVVNLDFRYTQSGWLQLNLEALGLDERQPYQAHDLLSDSRFLWQGARNYVECNPQEAPAHILAIRRKVRTERDFDYYL